MSLCSSHSVSRSASNWTPAHQHEMSTSTYERTIDAATFKCRRAAVHVMTFKKAPPQCRRTAAGPSRGTLRRQRKSWLTSSGTTAVFYSASCRPPHQKAHGVNGANKKSTRPSFLRSCHLLSSLSSPTSILANFSLTVCLLNWPSPAFSPFLYSTFLAG